MKIARQKNLPTFREQTANTQPEVIELVVEECTHDRRKIRIPPIIRRRLDWCDNTTYEYCAYCGEITRFIKW